MGDDVVVNKENSVQYLTFILDNEEYGVDILTVQELRGWEEPTPIPNMPRWVEGVINLRGVIVPIIGLRQRFSLGDREPDPTTVVVIVKVASDEHERVLGLVVDGVSEVYTIEPGALQPPPNMGQAISTDFIKGLTTIDDKMVILLDVFRLINQGVLASVLAEQQGDSDSSDA